MAQPNNIELPSCIDHFYFPYVPCSIPARCSPFLDACLQACEECTKGDDTIKEGAVFLCWVVPGADMDRDNMILGSKLFGALFAVDDDVGELELHDEKLVGMVMQAVQYCDADSAGTDYNGRDYEYKPGELISKINFPQFALFEETVREFRSRAHPSLYSRFAEHMAEYLTPARGRACDNLYSSVEEYFAMRLDDAFALGTLCVMEFCIVGSREVTQIREPLFQALCRAACRHASLVNDLFSFRKEYYAGRWANNILAVLFRERAGRGGFQAAVDRCCDMIGEAERELLSLRDQLLAREDLTEELRQLAVHFPYLAPGNLQYSAIAPRYNGRSNTLLTGHVYHGTLLMHPRATVVLPPAPPAAAPLPADHQRPPVRTTAHTSSTVIPPYKPPPRTMRTLARPFVLHSSFNIAASIHVHAASGRQHPLTLVL